VCCFDEAVELVCSVDHEPEVAWAEELWEHLFFGFFALALGFIPCL
jgi:hypothetical protein